MPILRAANLSKSFFGLQALQNFSVEVQHRLEIARALATGPNLLLLDGPSARPGTCPASPEKSTWEIAQRSGYLASFMTKPYSDQSASGCHLHHSLLDTRTGRSAFSSAKNPQALSDTCRWWVGGQIKHATGLTGLLSPTVNCVKRYKLYSFAPTNATWGMENRTVGLRVKVVKGESAHVENRMPGGGSNPYLVMAGVLAAGLDGLRNHTEPSDAVEGIAYGLPNVTDLPKRLEQSLDAFEADAVPPMALGEEFTRLFTAVKRHEIQKARAAIPEYDQPTFLGTVTDWERAEYFEFL